MILESNSCQAPYDRDWSPLSSLSHDKLCGGSEFVGYGDVLESERVAEQVLLTPIVNQRIETGNSDALFDLTLPERTAPCVAYDNRDVFPGQLLDSLPHSSGGRVRILR